MTAKTIVLPEGEMYDVVPAVSADVESIEDELDIESFGEKPRYAHQLPKPTGYKLLIALPNPDETTEGGIVKAAETLHREEVASICGFVMDMGPDAYSDSKRFPNGPYCKKGDWIVMRAYSGTRFRIHGKEFRLINDDTVEAVVEDPRGVIKV